MEHRSVVKACGEALVALVPDRSMTSSNSSSHPIGAMARSGDPVRGSSLVIRLPRLRSILDVRDLEIATCLLIPYLLGLRGSADVGLDDVAIGLIL